VNCLWAEPKNPQMLAAKMQHLIKDAALRKSMSYNNQSLAAEFSARAVTAEYIVAFEKIVGKSK